MEAITHTVSIASVAGFFVLGADMNKQKKLINLGASAEFKAALRADGPGEIIGGPSAFYVLDDVGDIVLPGAYLDTIPEFVKSGFIAADHEWAVGEGVIGMILEARETATGLMARAQFHSTDDAQVVRRKAAERLEAGKDVFLSIGYMVEDSETIYPDEYAEELPKYIPAEMLDSVIAKATRFPCVRLLKRVKLFEFSVVAWPANTAAKASEVKAANPDTKTLGDPVAPAATFADELEMALAAVKGCAVRARDIHEVRAKEGRTLSAANRAKLQTVCDSMRACADEMAGWLADTEPKAKTAPALDLELVVREAEAAQLLRRVRLAGMGLELPAMAEGNN